MTALLCAFVAAVPGVAAADDEGGSSPARQNAEEQSAPPKKADDDDPDGVKLSLGGYVETFYQWNFAMPGNGITNYRAYDDRHNTFTLSNAVLERPLDASRAPS